MIDEKKKKVLDLFAEGRKNYTKTKPLRYEEFEPMLVWWDKREENEQAWRVDVREILQMDAQGSVTAINLDLKNPNVVDRFEHMPPDKIVQDVLSKEKRVVELLSEVEAMLSE